MFKIATSNNVDGHAGWVNNLSSGENSGAKGFMFFIIDVDLTETGIGEFIHPSIHSFIHPSIYTSIYSSIISFMHPFINKSIHLLIH